MDRYSGHHEIRFKVTDKESELFNDVAYYFYEHGFIDKPNIQTFGRWCLTHAANTYKNEVIQAKLIRHQKIQQLMQQRQVQQQHHPMQQQNLRSQLVYRQQEKQKLKNIDDILAEEERQMLSDLESLEL